MAAAKSSRTPIRARRAGASPLGRTAWKRSAFDRVVLQRVVGEGDGLRAALSVIFAACAAAARFLAATAAPACACATAPLKTRCELA